MEQGGSHSGGFTIVETMIVLAVTAILAVSAMLLVNGRQNKTEFQTAINDLQQQMQQIINETASGFYPNNGNFSCVPNLSAPPRIAYSSSAPPQGTNSGCLFLGKAIWFGSSGSYSGKGGQNGNYTIYALAGNALDSSGNEVTTLAAARPTAIAQGVGVNDAPGDSGLGNGVTDVTEEGLTINSVTFSPAVNNSTVLAVISSLGSYNGSDLNSGSQNFSLYGVSGAPQSDTSGNIVDAIAANNSFTPVQSVALCFQSGTTNQSGMITIGSATGGGLGVSLQIYENTDCSS